PTMTGSFSVSFDESLAIEIMFRMLGERPTKIDADVTDMVGEITNMVTGGAKRMLGEKGYEFTMATPIVVSGKSHTITHRCDGPTILMPFTSDFGKVHIEVTFDK
ncbi:chemotaxis protein CheX, partial [Alishewanella sp. SMS9]|nr:chemotaxis protein CheX [Alishewanella sp. SMS9]